MRRDSGVGLTTVLKLRGGCGAVPSTANPCARVSPARPTLITPSASSDVGRRPPQQARGSPCQSYAPPPPLRSLRPTPGLVEPRPAPYASCLNGSTCPRVTWQCAQPFFRDAPPNDPGSAARWLRRRTFNSKPRRARFLSKTHAANRVRCNRCWADAHC